MPPLVGERKFNYHEISTRFGKVAIFPVIDLAFSRRKTAAFSGPPPGSFIVVKSRDR
jgi:hypothetical protein